MPRNPGCVLVVISDREITGIKKPFKVSKELLKRWILKICITLEIIHSISNRVPLVLMCLFVFFPTMYPAAFRSINVYC